MESEMGVMCKIGVPEGTFYKRDTTELLPVGYEK